MLSQQGVFFFPQRLVKLIYAFALRNMAEIWEAPDVRVSDPAALHVLRRCTMRTGVPEDDESMDPLFGHEEIERRLVDCICGPMANAEMFYHVRSSRFLECLFLIIWLIFLICPL